ncbi:MAG: substrate-binding domain-containing protein [Chloroflexi bacterium]|nr:substrate-binding domain-containing protein [Chloroflexota bacterium]
MITSRSSRRLAVGVATAALALTSIGGGAVLAQDAKPNIVVVVPALDNAFWQVQKNGADQAGTDFGANVQVQGPPSDTGDANMIPFVQAAIAAQPDGIALDYTSKTMEAAVVAALDAGIPVVLYNNNRFEGDNAPDDPRIAGLAFSGQDEQVSGEILGDSWASALKDSACPVLIVNPYPSAFVLTLRADGMKRALAARGNPAIDLEVNPDPVQAEGSISAKLQESPDICGIVGLGNPGANPAAKYVSENNLGIPIATFDVGAETAKWIKDGVITMAINQQPFLQSYFAVANLANQVKYNLSPVNVNTGTSLVTKDNIATVQACIDAGRC